MDTDAKNALIAEAYHALLHAEQNHPDSPSLAVLHAVLARVLEAYIAENGAGIVRPYDGTNKPPG